MFKMILLILALFLSLNAYTIKDMTGKEIHIKKDIKKIYTSSPIDLYSLYAVDREKIAGLNFPFNQGETPYLDKSIVNLPVLGGWFGKGRTPNAEMILQVNPDVIVVSEFTKKLGEKKIKKSLGNVDIPLFYLRSNTLEELSDTFFFLGKLTGKEQRAQELENYAKKSLSEAKELRKTIKNKPRVYYAEGKNGLQTECHKSLHSELITLSGGENVHKCEIKNRFGRQTVNFEQILNYNPEIILIYDKDFYKQIYKDTKWQLIDAVKNKKVYFLPKGPFSWFDRPPSFMKFLGLKWMMNLFHPDHYPLDINNEAKKFYKLFLDMEIEENQLKKIMGKDIE